MFLMTLKIYGEGESSFYLTQENWQKFQHITLKKIWVKTTV